MCCLLSGGGYAEKVAVPAGQVLPVPPGVSLKDATAFPEVACTVWSTVFMTSRLTSGESLLVICLSSLLSFDSLLFSLVVQQLSRCCCPIGIFTIHKINRRLHTNFVSNGNSFSISEVNCVSWMLVSILGCDFVNNS